MKFINNSKWKHECRCLTIRSNILVCERTGNQSCHPGSKLSWRLLASCGCFPLFWSVTECDAGLRQFRGFWVMSFSLLWRFCVFHVFCASVHRALLWWASGPIMSSCVPGIKFLNGLLLAQWAFINIQPLCVKVLSQLEVIKFKWWLWHAILQSKCSLGSYSCVSTSSGYRRTTLYCWSVSSICMIKPTLTSGTHGGMVLWLKTDLFAPGDGKVGLDGKTDNR